MTMRVITRTCLLAFLALGNGFSSPQATGQVIELQPGDHVVLIGNGLAERMQYFGQFEAQLHLLHPQHRLTIRNQGYMTDEVRFRPRSLDFGPPDQHLSLVGADVILAFFGFNESFQGPEGVTRFQQELRDFIEHTRQQKYNGESRPRLVLISPIAHENLKSPNLPDGVKTNANLAIYTRALAQTAEELDVPFVDLFTASQRAMSSSETPWSFNGVHLTETGYRQLAPILAEALFGRSVDPARVPSQLMSEISEKCFQYFHRYRAVNGFYIYGGRSRRDNGNPPFTDNYVLENERRKLDEMCAIRDARIWKVAAGEQVPSEIDDSTTRPLYDVPTNFKQPIVILPPEEAIKKFTVAEGYAVNLFASEVDFPEIKNPVQLTFDDRGRLWIATMPTYPQYQPPDKPNDKLIILEDTDGDGRADKRSVFADDLHLPTGFELGDGGAYVAQEPNLVFLKDTDGDGRYDFKRVLLGGFDSADSHHAIGAFQWGPGGGIYMHEGTFHITQVETPYGPVRNGHGAVYRFDPTRHAFETFVHYNFANPWGHCFDRWGQNFVADASGGANYFGTAFSLRSPNYDGSDDFGPFKFVYRRQMNQFFKKRVRPTAGCEIVSSRHFPPEAQGNYLLNNCIGFQGVLQHTVRDEGSGFAGEEIEPLLFSSDRNFRPTDLQFGPDGALYVVDWFNPLIGHMQHNLRDPNRDHTHGRIWRITYPSRPLVKPVQIAERSLEETIELLREPENRTRNRVRIKLREFPTSQVVSALNRWIEGLDEDDAEFEHLLLEALWVQQHHNAVDRTLLLRLLNADDYRARAAATRVLCYTRHRLDDVNALLRKQANDRHPRVRLEAVRACSWVNSSASAEIALEVVKYSMDYYLDYALGETMRFLEPHWKTAVREGRPFAAGNPQGIEYILGSIPTPDLVRVARTAPVYEALLSRPQVKDEFRVEALQGLAKLEKTTELAQLSSAIERLDLADSETAETVLFDLALLLSRRDPSELVTTKARFEEWTRSARRRLTRQLGFMALATADQSMERVWKLALASPARMQDFLDSLQIIPDVTLKQTLYARVSGLLDRIPEPLATQAARKSGPSGRFVRIQLPGNGQVLTLAEVEIFSGGQNVARNGKASQSSTGYGGTADRAIDGNRDGRYAAGSQTHTAEGSRQPWWEVDLGREVSIDSIAIWNRTESNGQYAKRLDRFQIIIRDENGRQVFRRNGIPAPEESSRFQLESNPTSVIRRSAMNAITYLPGHDQESFNLLARFVRNGRNRAAAVQAMMRIPRYRWPKDQLQPIADSLVAYATGVDAKQRATVEVRSVLQLANEIATLLPEDAAAKVRTTIGDLGVRMITIRTIPHRMRYDRSEIVVQAGKPIEVVLDNTDIMPHNLLILKPGRLQDVAQAGERMATQPDAFERQFVPDSDAILHASRLLQSRETERLVFVAPSETGDYPYVCTFPGHWRTMNGVIHVVDDVEAYLAANPISEPETIAEVRPFVRDWTMADLEDDISELKGRSFANGKQLFTQIACFNCHMMNGVGGQVGPDLAKLDKTRDRRSLLESLIQPSKVVDKKFQAWVVITNAGKQFTGLMLDQNDQAVTLMPNPLGKDMCEPEVIPRKDIDEMQASPLSLMPEKLLNTMKREEILDLLAYIESRGNPEHALFQTP